MALIFNTRNYQRPGGSTWTVGGNLDVASGGKVKVESGGLVTIESGGQVVTDNGARNRVFAVTTLSSGTSTGTALNASNVIVLASSKQSGNTFAVNAPRAGECFHVHVGNHQTTAFQISFGIGVASTAAALGSTVNSCIDKSTAAYGRATLIAHSSAQWYLQEAEGFTLSTG